MALKVLDLFSGLGGSSLGIAAADLHHIFEPTQFIEWNPYCASVLNKWFPTVPVHCDNIRNFHTKPGDFQILMISAPCQPHSLAGNQKGNLDDRDLWKECFRLIQQSTPIGFILENVPGIRHSNKGQFLRDILRDIASLGYNAEWGILSVQALGGVHERKRFFLIAYSQSQRWTSQQLQNTSQKGTDSTPSTPHNSTVPHWTSTISKAHAMDAGLPDFLAGCLMTYTDLPEALRNATVKATPEKVREALQAVGNSICPQVCGKVWQRLYERLTLS